MTAFWTLLVFTAVSGPMADKRVGIIWYPSLDACMAAHQIVAETLPYDHKIECMETTVMSSSVRPPPRPEGLGDE